MNNLRAINTLVRGTHLVEVTCTATTAQGKKEEVKVKVAYNKLNKLQGNGLTSKDIYTLKKTGACTSKDTYGNSFTYVLGEHSRSTDRLKPTAPTEPPEPKEETVTTDTKI